ncbi:MAG TPA: beta-ketoacyl-ACP synthase II [Phycisphaerae bacterium]|nr:beta-ketoacyl-ACP synthase II [Phycisphaerae bacterium]
MARRRVVLTGLGTVNPLAHNVEGFWAGLLAGNSGIRPIARFDAGAFSCRIGGEVQDWTAIPYDLVEARESKRMDRFTQFAVAAAIEAVADSGLDFSRERPEVCGVIVGTGIGGLQELEDQHRRMLEKGPGRVSPFTVPKLMGNAASAHVSFVWGLKGPNFCTCTACASGANAIGEAYRVIQYGRCDVVVTGGSEAALTPIGLASFCALKGLSTRNDEPARACRPFDRGRDGFLLSEGAGVVILEELEHALARDARIYAEFIGYGASADAYHLTAPDPKGDGAVFAMEGALRDAGINPEDVDYINAHGTSTVLGDVAETRAIKRTFGAYAAKGLMVSSTKSSVGHLLGASGGVEMIACVKAIEAGVVPPTLNLEDPDDECDLDYVPLVPREAKIKTALSSSFGFGGHNACLLIKRFEG